MKKVAILQSNYIPWKGYFDMIAAVDIFIIYDDVQYTKNDWRNRNKIKTISGTQWLTIPVGTKIHQRISDVSLPDQKWQKKHWQAIITNYGKAPYFKEISAWLQELYLNFSINNLSELNFLFINEICHYLGISTRIVKSSEFVLSEGKTERLADICSQVEATEYISGPAAMNYLDTQVFFDRGINVSWFNYEDYPVYPQLWGPFIHEVSIIDLLFNCGKNAIHYMKYV